MPRAIERDILFRARFFADTMNSLGRLIFGEGVYSGKVRRFWCDIVFQIFHCYGGFGRGNLWERCCSGDWVWRGWNVCDIFGLRCLVYFF